MSLDLITYKNNSNVSQSLDFNPIENLWWDLKAVTARKSKNITELEAIAHVE